MSEEKIDEWIARKLKEEPGWRPYCLKCNTMGRMTPIEGGFKCNGEGDHFGRPGCGNEIGYDMRRKTA